MMEMNKEFMITEGSKYKVNHGEDELTEGIFRGLSVIGNDTAMVFELADGILRFVNTSQIIYMDLIEAAPNDSAEPVSKAYNSVYYG